MLFCFDLSYSQIHFCLFKHKFFSWTDFSIFRSQAPDVKKHTLLAFYSWKDKKDYTLLHLSLTYKYQTSV